MAEETNVELLCQRLSDLRTGKSEFRKSDHSYSQQEIADMAAEVIKKDVDGYYRENGITPKEKSFYSDLENNKKKKSENVLKYARVYFDIFKLDQDAIEKIMHSTMIVVLDEGVLMNMPHIIKTFENEYYKIIIGEFAFNKIIKYKNDKKNRKSKQARKVINEINDAQDKIIIASYEGNDKDSEAKQIECITQEKAKEYVCNSLIITYSDETYAYFAGKQSDSFQVMKLKDYNAKHQHILPEKIDLLSEVREKKDGFEGSLDLSKEDMDSFFIDGRTLISACVCEKLDFEKKKEKIKWLIDNGADINQRDRASDFFPPLTTAVQRGDFEMVCFLLDECKCDPNVGSRYPYNKGTIGIQNEGNTALMVAAFHGYDGILRKLCSCNDISINQQDRNGYTALIKASMNANDSCRNILLSYGADAKIRDFNGVTAEGHYNKKLEKMTNQDKIQRLQDENKLLEKTIEENKKKIKKLQK